MPSELIAIVEKAMARAPADRYATADGLAQDLRRFQAGKLVAAHHYSSWQLVRRWVVRHRAIVLTAAIAVAVLIAVGLASISRITAERDEANTQRARAQQQRGEALAASALAEQRFADSLEELARQAERAGASDRALALLAGEVTVRAVFPPTFDILASQARATYAGLIALAPAVDSGVSNARISRDGHRLYIVSAHGEGLAWDVTGRRVAWTANGIDQLEPSPDDRWLVGATRDGGVFVRAADTGAIAASWPGTSAETDARPTVFSWARDGERFAAISPNGRVILGTRVGAAPRELTPRDQAAADDRQHRVLARRPAPRDRGRRRHDLRARRGHRRDARQADRISPAPPSGGASPGCPTLDHAAPSAIAGLAWLDDDRIVTGDDHGVARIWHASTRAVERRVVRPSAIYGFVVGTAGSPRSATANRSRPTTARPARCARRCTAQIGCDYAVSDGTHLITTDETGAVFVWDPDTGEQLRALPAEGTSIAVSARGDLVVVYAMGRTRVFRFDGDARVRHLPGHTARIRDLAFAPDGTLWSASNDGSARGFDFATGKARVLGVPAFREPPIVAIPTKPVTPNPHGLRSLTISPDGALVVTANEDGTIGVWDENTGAPRATWTGHTGRVRRVVFARDGHTAYSVGDTTLRAWDVATGRELGHAALDAKGWDVALADGDRTIATETETNQVMLWHAADLSPVLSASLANKLRELAVTSDRILIASATQLFRLGVDGAPELKTTHNSAFGVAISARWIAATNASDEIQLTIARRSRRCAAGRRRSSRCSCASGPTARSSRARAIAGRACGIRRPARCSRRRRSCRRRSPRWRGRRTAVASRWPAARGWSGSGSPRPPIPRRSARSRAACRRGSSTTPRSCTRTSIRRAARDPGN